MIQLQSSRFEHTFYQKFGEGFPIFLIHGFGEKGDIWQKQIAALQTKYTVLVPDLPGSGLSALPKESITIELFADFIAEIMQQEKIDSTLIFGHSMGGYITLAYAEKYPNTLMAFGLIHSSAYADDDEKKMNRKKSMALISNHDNGKEVFLQAMIPNLYAEISKKNNAEDIQKHLTMAMEISSLSLLAYYQSMIDRKDTTNVLKTYPKPVLFVIGTEDNAVPMNHMLEQSYLPQISSIEIMEHVGHTSMYEAPEKLNSSLLSFCDYVLSS